MHKFTFEYLKKQYRAAIQHGYQVIGCADYVELKRRGLPPRLLVNRIDIDYSVKKADIICGIFNELKIKGTFFIRLHAPEYNPFSFENYRILKNIVASGHEVGYHSEVLDESLIWNEEASECLARDIDVLNRLLGIEIKGVASHNSLTGVNNLDFWQNNRPSDFGLLYEAYDKQPAFNLFSEGLYISDSEWNKWKCYDKGILVENDKRDPDEHVAENHSLIYLLIHSDSYYHRHFYE